ncbi:MAG: hypothetical protein Q4D21_10760 [Phascolarctobacterium sp.]|nr:hypothetical protein [Phascolarctobacterium sp.]
MQLDVKNKSEIDSIKVNDQVFKVGYDAYAAYDFISRISAITATTKAGIVEVNIYHKLDQVFNDAGTLVDVDSPNEYLFKTIYSPDRLEIRYKHDELNRECKKFQEELNSKNKH